jgi:type F conjugative transfer system protein TrbI
VGSSKKDAPKGPDAAKLHVPDLDTERADADRGRPAKQARESAPFFHGSSLAFGSGSGDSDIIRALRESTGQTTNRAGQRLIERELNVQPTLTVRPGWPLCVIVHKDLVLAPYRDETVK